jgi:hypothetical protein
LKTQDLYAAFKHQKTRKCLGFRVQGELQNPIPPVTYTNHEEAEHLNWNMCFSSKLSISENQVYEKTGKLRDDATDKRCNNKLPHWNSKRSARPEE